MIRRLIKLGSYLVIAGGVLVALLLLGFAIYLWIFYPGDTQIGRIVIAMILLIAAVASLIVTFALFETMVKTLERHR